MAEMDVLPMHTDFARWHSTIEIGDDAIRRQKRWQGVSNIVNHADSEIVETLIRLVFQTRHLPAPAILQKIRQFFREADDIFDMHNNDREIKILASVCLAVLMSRGGDIGAKVALAATTTAFGNARISDDIPMDLLILAEHAIGLISEDHRKRPELVGDILGKAPKIDFQESVVKIEEAQNFSGVTEAFKLTSKAVQKAINTITQQQSKAILAMNDFIRIQDEELQMLWWLTGRFSWDYDCMFETVPANIKSLVFANELAESTQFLPGPPSIKALLSRAGLKEKKSIKISAAINTADETWLQKLVDEIEPSPVTTPLHFAIKRRLETGGTDAWVAAWAATVNVNADYSMTELTLGSLFYRERLLILFG